MTLVTSIYFSGIGNDYFLGVYSFTHGSMRRWCLKSPEMDQKIISCFTGIRIRVFKMRCWWRPFRFIWKIFTTFSLNRLIPYPIRLCYFICDWEFAHFTILRWDHLSRIELSAGISDASISSSSSRSTTSVSPFQILSAF